MSISTPQISGVSFSMNIAPATYGSIKSPTAIVVPVPILGTTKLYQFQGVFTPNNDYIVVCSFSAQDVQPNWFLFMCDCQANFRVDNSLGPIINTVPVNKMFFMTNETPVNKFTNIYIDGRLNVPVKPMEQAVPMTWCLYAGDGSVS
jgi:hypothetical protein